MTASWSRYGPARAHAPALRAARRWRQLRPARARPARAGVKTRCPGERPRRRRCLSLVPPCVIINGDKETRMQDKIIGTTMPVLEMTLDPGDSIIAEAGELSWLTSTIALHTSTSAGANKGFFGAIKRAVGGGTLFMTQYTANGGPGMVAFATKVPGHILPVAVSPSRGYLIHRHGFLCGTSEIELSVGFQRSLGAG